MPERPIALVTNGTLECVLIAEIDGMLERSVSRDQDFSAKRLVEGCVTDTAFVSDHLALFAEVLTVVTAKTSLSVEVADVVRMR